MGVHVDNKEIALNLTNLAVDQGAIYLYNYMLGNNDTREDRNEKNSKMIADFYLSMLKSLDNYDK